MVVEACSTQKTDICIKQTSNGNSGTSSGVCTVASTRIETAGDATADAGSTNGAEPAVDAGTEVGALDARRRSGSECKEHRCLEDPSSEADADAHVNHATLPQASDGGQKSGTGHAGTNTAAGAWTVARSDTSTNAGTNNGTNASTNASTNAGTNAGSGRWSGCCRS